MPEDKPEENRDEHAKAPIEERPVATPDRPVTRKDQGKEKGGNENFN